MTYAHHVARESLAASAGLIITALVYTRGWLRVRRLDSNTVGAWRVGSFLLGLVLIWTAIGSPVAGLDHTLLTAHMMGNRAEPLYDVGVAGIHRLLEHREKLASARVIICVAGMEGALPSVVGGLVGVPVIAVPTSTGYGASFGGVAALLGMLNSCASNVTVVNIDNGFGAGCVASCINRL